MSLLRMFEAVYIYHLPTLEGLGILQSKHNGTLELEQIPILFKSPPREEFTSIKVPYLV